jgi:hypothetical protein
VTNATAYCSPAQITEVKSFKVWAVVIKSKLRKWCHDTRHNGTQENGLIVTLNGALKE